MWIRKIKLDLRSHKEFIRIHLGSVYVFNCLKQYQNGALLFMLENKCLGYISIILFLQKSQLLR